MELDLDDANFWLPSEFLNEDDIFNTGKMIAGILNGFGSYSDLSSPVESVMGSTETESDEEDYLNELTRKLANSALDDDDDKFSKPDNKSTRVLAGSPQSTLCGCKEVSVNDYRLPVPAVTGNRNQIAPQPPRRIPNPNPQFHQIQEMIRRSRVNNGGGGMIAPVWGTGMRAVFLGNTKRDSTGTGVFLPRQIGAPTQTRKKKDVEMRYRNNVMMGENDIRLPQEWTY